ncbi:heparin sulfate O-sulfotransferase [Onthophagus taurus]|uniref:heparin sulfate O-sulfotransferase n=1 Tax=Onthophagus taurus TaxID=166361 RepID=UPI000C1FE0B7|nr:heparin sulfate O-sulfotransferase [Onthophagus taurus]
MLKFRLGLFLTVFCTAVIAFVLQYQILKLQDELVKFENLKKIEENIINEDVEDVDDVVVIYNRVPKTGSTSFVGVAYDLCKKNNFHVIHVNITANNHRLSLPNQYKLVNNITKWSDMKPALYHGHFAYLDFTKFSKHKPMYINIIRKPLDRLVSYYYFLRYGDDFRPHLVRRKHGDTMTFDECVSKSQPDCDPNNMWLQIPFFCGHTANCLKPGNKWALQEAKKNLINNYLLVGVTEDIESFINILELTIPRLFIGAMDYFNHSNKSNLRKTAHKEAPTEETVKKIQNSVVWQMENELYEFALEQFNFVKKLSLGEKSQRFFFEKIRPKSS